LLKPLIVFLYTTAVVAVLFMNGYNVGIDGSSIRHIFRFDFYFVAGGCFAFAFLLHAFTVHRLRPVEAFLDDASSKTMTEKEAFLRLTRFPNEAFVAVLAFGTFFSALYHTLEVYWFRFRPFDELVIRHLVVEQAFGWTLAFVFMAAAQRLLRPHLHRLRALHAPPSRTSSFVPLWLAVFVAGMAFTAIPPIWYIRNILLEEAAPSAAAVAIVSLTAMTVAAGVAMAFFFAFRKELRGLSAAIRSLIRQDVRGQTRMLPIATRDEVGELAAVINALRTKAAKEDEELRNDLALAESVQRMLFPPKRQTFDGMSVLCEHRAAKAVGSDFHDCIRLADGRAALAIGEVSGEGVSAALMMTATAMLLRTELRGGGGAGEVLSRLNASVWETGGGEAFVTLGLAIVDSAFGLVEYAGAGQTSPVLLRGGAPRMNEIRALPLGAEPNAAYRSERWEIEEGDRLIFFTSGFAEHYRSEADENGYRAIERALAAAPAGLSAEALADWLASRAEAAPARKTDRTLLIADWTDRSAGEAMFHG